MPGRGLARFLTEGTYALRHIAGGSEARIVRVNYSLERRGLLSQLIQLVIVKIFALLGPNTSAFLDEPQAADVLEHTNAAEDAAFIREAMGKRGFGRDGLGRFDAHERPCPAN